VNFLVLANGKIDSGDTAWLLMSSALVMLMVPGLALFYGGMVRRKNILGTMMHSMVALGLIGVQWVLIGYALAFGATQGGFIGFDARYLALVGVKPDDVFPGTSIPVYVHCIFQGMFAILTPALISGAFAERVRFGPYCLFVLLWATLVYDPLAHWVWSVGPDSNDPSKSAPIGWLGSMGALDFAGGTVVHVAAGFSGLAAILLLPTRRGYPQHVIHPNSMVLTLTGAGLLWFGWFGFNGGSALAANGQSGMALTVTQVAAAAAALVWIVVEWLHRGKPTALGLATGLVAGLVAITPASGFVSPFSALWIGSLASLVCYTVVAAKPWLKYDDSLDAFGVHGVGGFLGALLTGLFALTPVEDSVTKQFGVQVLATVSAAVYSFVMTLVLVKVIDSTWGFSLSAEEEAIGLDRNEHGEVGFDYGAAPLEEVAESAPPEPRPASFPPQDTNRYTLVVEGVPTSELIRAWSAMCQKTSEPPSPLLKTVYPLVTTVSGNRFRFRGGDRVLMRGNLQRLFEDSLGASVHVHVEENSDR
jgi:Amt family ammonium transporter